MSNLRAIGSLLYKESGAITIIKSPRDTKLLCLQRFVRLFAYGASFLILVHFLTSLGIDDAHVGLFMTSTMLGDVVISFCLTLITDKVGRRLVLTAGAGLMALSGVVFAMTSNYWLLLLASVVGVISPSGNEIGPFKAVEESILTQLSETHTRSDIFAWYTLFGTAGAAFGSLTSGFSIAYLQSLQSWTSLDAYRVIFIVYAVLGGLKLVLALMLSNAVELEAETPIYEEVLALESQELLSEESSDDNEVQVPPVTKPRTRMLTSQSQGIWHRIASLVPTISPVSRGILVKLIGLFAIDSFASGLASPSWLTYFFTTVHSLPSQVLGTLFLTTNLLATVSNLLALPIARRIGPLKTMTFTHLPSAVFLGLVPFPPATVYGTWLAMGFLALRACTQSMDQAPRQAFLGAAILPAERTAVLGMVNIAKTLAQAAGIGSAGPLAGAGQWIIMFFGAGLLKATYDLLMLWMFLGLKDREVAQAS